ncbi:uncharacterized protein LOC143631971 [Bidens hawaiensis]|uniref:uncharacterized protein LOC143631971 n=1 Tax=Bidens hawaiensis TaxID=980011 RepID=UPI00404980A5
MHKFIQKSAVEKPIEEQDVEEREHANEQDHVEVVLEEPEEEEHVEANINEEHVKYNHVDIFDPRRWEGLNSDEIKLLVEKGRKKDNNIVNGPYDKHKRRFSSALYTRTLSNLEKCDRPWLVYSIEVDKIFCFCCKVFRKGLPNGNLDGEGYNNWHHASTSVKNHEVSLDHLKNMNSWFDMRKRLKLNETIDKTQYEQFKKERDCWIQVLLRIVALVKFLAKNNLAFRGTKEKLYQKEALLEVGEKDGDLAIANEATTIAENIGFDFLVSIIIWYEVLDKEFRENGFSKAIDEAEKIAFEMDIDPIFAQKLVIKRKKQSDECSSSQEASFTPQENFRVSSFLYIIDQAITSLETRFDQFKNYEKLFGFLFPQNLRGIEDEDLNLSCNFLENALKFEGRSDIDGEALYMELSSLDTLYTMEFSSLIEVLKHLNETQENFPNARIAYRILLTIPVTVASAERSFSKLKLLKSYLRSTISQERLNGLAMIAIESEILDSINCEDVIKQFAVKNTRRASRIIG